MRTVAHMFAWSLKECTEFWPKGEEIMDRGHFKVTSLTEEESHESYSTHDFLLQSTQVITAACTCISF